MNIHALRLTSALAALILFASTEANAEFEWHAEDGQHIELQHGDQPVVRYMHTPIDESSPEAREKTYKPYLHVFSPDGETLLTKGPGGLFPHHRGIFFGFNRITYGDGLKCDTWHCTGKAHQSHVEVLEQGAGEDSATLKVNIHWHGQHGEAFADEHRTMTMLHRGDDLQIDFVSRLEPIEAGEIHLDGDPQHAGVQFRATQHVPDHTAKQTYYIRTDGRGEPGDYRNWDHQKADDPMNEEAANRPWLAMSFVVDDQRYTVLYIDHPNNPKPARYSERDYGRFGSYFETRVTKDRPLEVRYRYIVRKGEMTVDECSVLHDKFVSGIE